MEMGKQVVIDVPFNPQRHISNSYMSLPTNRQAAVASIVAAKKHFSAFFWYLNSDKRSGGEKKLTQCDDGWQCGAWGLNGVERLPPRIKAVPNDETWSGYVQGKSPCARNCSKIGINSARCSSAVMQSREIFFCSFKKRKAKEMRKKFF